MTAEDAYNVIEGPLMALIGGSLAIAKNLLTPDKEDGQGADANALQSPAGDLSKAGNPAPE